MFKIVIEKAAKSYEIDFDALPEVSRNRVIAYGLTQLLSDAAAPVAVSANIDGKRIPLVGKDLAKAQVDAKALVDQRLSDLEAGILRRAREGSGDPVESEARKMALAIVRTSPVFKTWLAKFGHKATDKPAVDKLAELAAPVAARPNVIAAAQARVEQMLSLDVEIDINI